MAGISNTYKTVNQKIKPNHIRLKFYNFNMSVIDSTIHLIPLAKEYASKEEWWGDEIHKKYGIREMKVLFYGEKIISL